VKRKLTRFQDFAESLLPHETGWLMDNHQLVDAEKIEILACLDHNTRLPSHPKPFDDTIDKRKYSYMIRWVQERLHSIDVDEQYKLITFLDQQIATDILQPEDEQQLSRIIRETNHRSFNFSRIFDLVRHYRHFLLIRMRYRQHKEADDFLRTYQAQYQHSRDINDKIHYATLDIVKQYAGSPAESIQWERWLTDVYNDENLDGNNRYMALVRLTFLYFNYRQFDRLVTKFDAYDALLEQGIYYSRRLLINYYNNRLLLHNYLEEYDKAIWYGFLSIREKNADYFHYVNTLSGVLLRQERFAEALEILRKAYSELRNVSSFHNRLLFITFYLRALHENGLSRNADNYAETFIRAYSDEIFDHRWHLFFTVVFDVLLSRERTSRIVHLARKYQLLRKEEEHIQRTGGLPYLKWQTALASFVEMRITRTQLEKEMATLSEQDISSSGPGLQIFKAHLKRLAPEITRKGRVG
jgi:tetratricopeptide (TPR) repeat protein